MITDLIKKPSSGTAIVKLLAYALSFSKKRFFIAVIALCFGLALEGVSIFLLLPLFGFLATTSSDFSKSFSLTIPGFGDSIGISLQLHEILIIFVLIVTSAAAINRAKNIFVSNLVLDTTRYLRMNLFMALSGAKWAFLVQKRRTEIEFLLNGSVEKIQGSLSAAFALVQNVNSLFIYTAISIFVSPTVTAVAVVSGAFSFALSAKARQLSAEFGDRHLKIRKEQLQFTTDFLHGLKLVKSHSAEFMFRDVAKESFSSGDNEYKFYISRISLSSFIIQTINLVMAASIMYVAIFYAGLTIEYIVLLAVVFLRINPKFSALQSNIEQILTDAPAFTQMKSMEAEFLAHAECSSDIDSDIRHSIGSEIKVKNASFSLGGNDILTDVSITLKPNDLTVLCGASGSGKTTLADLMMGLFEPQHGTLHLGDRALTGDLLPLWRKRIAYVPQQSFLLSASVRDNLSFGIRNLTDQELFTALSQSNALALVQNMRAGLDTMVGDGGLQMSGGELQRLALARALVRRPSLLILDEVTSGLDPKNRDLILGSLMSLRSSMTVLMISHDEEIIRRAPNIIELQNGKVIKHTYTN